MSEQAIQTMIAGAAPPEQSARPSFSGSTEQSSAGTQDASFAWVLTIAVVAAFLRLGLLLFGPMNDVSWSYTNQSPRDVALAQSIAEHNSFGLAEEPAGTVHKQVVLLRERLGQIEPTNAHGLTPETYRMPGYPLVLATIQRMGLPEYAALAAQAIMVSLAAMLAFVVGWKLLGHKSAGVLAATLVALHPGAVTNTNLITPEPLIMLLVMAGLAFAVSVKDKEGLNLFSAIGAGACLGLTALVQPLLILLGPVVALWALLTDFRLRTVGAAGCLLLCSLAPAGMWLMRNESVGFGYRLSSAPMVEAWFFTAAYMNIEQHDGDPETEWAGVVTTMVGELAANLQPGEEVVDASGRLALERMKDRPDLLVNVLAQGAQRFFMSHSLLELHQQVGLDPQIDARPMESLVRWLNGGAAPTGSIVSVVLGSLWVILNVTLATLMIIGCLFMLVRGQWAALALVLGMLLLFVLGTQFIGLERARLPILALQGVAIAAVFLPDPHREKRLARKQEKQQLKAANKARRQARKPKVEIEAARDEPIRVSRGPLAALAAMEPESADEAHGSFKPIPTDDADDEPTTPQPRRLI